MNFNRCAVQTDRFDLYLDNVFDLQRLEHALQNAIFTPPVHAYIDCMPIPIGFRQCPPFATVFRDIQYRIDQLEITHTHILALTGQVFFDSFILLLCDFHIPIITFESSIVN